jgi:hypothetical protein
VEEKLSQNIDFKDQQGSEKALSDNEIRGFGFYGAGQFRLVAYTDPLDSDKKKTHFAKLLLEGAYQVLSFRRKDDLYFVVANNDTSYLLYDDIRTILGEMVENGNYRNLLSFISRDCPATRNTAENTRFTEQGFVSFFKSLEKCRAGLHRTVIYYSKPRSTMNVFLVAGAFVWNKETEISVQALLQFQTPSLSVKTSLSTGLVYLENSNKTIESYSFGEIRKKHSTEFFEVPFFIRYNILNKAIQPYIYGGPGVLLKRQKDITTRTDLSTETTSTSQKSAIGPTFVLVAGIAIRVTKSLFVDLNWRYDLGLHLPVAGLAFRIK